MVTRRLQARKRPVGICAGQSTRNWSKTGGQGQGRIADLRFSGWQTTTSEPSPQHTARDRPCALTSVSRAGAWPQPFGRNGCHSDRGVCHAVHHLVRADLAGQAGGVEEVRRGDQWPEARRACRVATWDTPRLKTEGRGSRRHRCGRCQGWESLTVFSRTDRTVPDYGVSAGHPAGC